MAGTRLRQVRLSWREGFDDRELVYNDQPKEMVYEDRPGEVEEQLRSAGWILQSVAVKSGNWTKVYGLRDETAGDDAPFRLVFTTNEDVIGPPGKDFRAAVAVRG